MMHNFRIKYQESSIGFENLAHLQSIQNKGDIYMADWQVISYQLGYQNNYLL